MASNWAPRITDNSENDGVNWAPRSTDSSENDGVADDDDDDDGSGAVVEGLMGDCSKLFRGSLKLMIRRRRGGVERGC